MKRFRDWLLAACDVFNNKSSAIAGLAVEQTAR
jgi:hypothetical protein